MIEADLQDAGIDVASGVLARRDGRWLRVRLAGLIYADTRLARDLGYAAALAHRHQPNIP